MKPNAATPARPRAGMPGADHPDRNAQPGVNLVGYVCAPIGLGAAARATAHLLLDRGVSLAIGNIGDKGLGRLPDSELTRLDPLITTSPPHDLHLLVFGADVGHGMFDRVMNRLPRGDAFVALLPFWELHEYPESFLALRGRVHAILAPTRFIQHGLLRWFPGVHVEYLPQGTGLTEADCALIPRRRSDRFTFFFNFDIGSSVHRKNPITLVRAYRAAFGRDANTRLVLKVSGMQHVDAPRVMQQLRVAIGDAPVKLVTEQLHRADMLSLIASSDVYVSPHRAEGLGLGLLEAMHLGVPCIATGFGGNTDFMHGGNSLLLRYETIDVQCRFYQHILRGRHAQWADPLFEDLVDGMRTLHADSSLRARLAAAGKISAQQQEQGFRDAVALDTMFSHWRRWRASRVETPGASW